MYAETKLITLNIHMYKKVFKANDNGINYTPDCDQLTKSEVDTVQLSKKDGAHRLIQGGAVHVDRAADGQHEVSDARIDV